MKPRIIKAPQDDKTETPHDRLTGTSGNFRLPPAVHFVATDVPKAPPAPPATPTTITIPANRATAAAMARERDYASSDGYGYSPTSMDYTTQSYIDYKRMRNREIEARASAQSQQRKLEEQQRKAEEALRRLLPLKLYANDGSAAMAKTIEDYYRLTQSGAWKPKN